MFRLFSKITGDEIKYLKMGDYPTFGPLMQYVGQGKSGRKYLALLSDGALSEFFFERTYKNPPEVEGKVSPAKVLFYGDVGGYTMALLELPEKQGEIPEAASQTDAPTLTDELRQQSIKALLAAFPSEVEASIRALDSFKKYEGLLNNTQSTELVWEFGNLTPDNYFETENGPVALSAHHLRPLQPAGYDLLTLGAKGEIPNAELNAAKDILIDDIIKLVQQKNTPEITGDWDCNDSAAKQPDSSYIYNRYDWLYGSGRVIAIKQWGREQCISVNIREPNAAIGLWLVPITDSAIDVLCDYLFKTYPKVKRIRYRFMLHPAGKATETNHYHIVIPETSDKLYASLSQHGRYDVRHKKRLAEKDLGGFTVTKMEKSEVPLSLVQTYYEYKKQTYNVPYLMPPERYMDAYHVSHVYRLDTASRGMEALLFSCEQGDDVYLENLTYDPQFRKYSIGQTLYDYYLNHLIDMKKKRLYLAGGEYEYKTRFGSVELRAYNGEIWRSGFDRAVITVGSKIKGGIRRLTGKVKKY